MNYITSGTIARTVSLVLALVNQFLAIKGMNPIKIEDEEINLLVSTMFTCVVAIITWWKNNSFTPPAIKADRYMNDLKSGRKAVDGK